jgi:DNA-directed RNA polymerase subunit RPC12/RpoP
MHTMSTAKLAVGSDIIYNCARCGLDLAHTILAMIGNEPARIRCNTCRSERNYRRKKTVDAILKSGVSRPKIVRPDFFQEKLKANAMKTVKAYRIDSHFDLNDIIQHPTFGKGVVIKTLFPDRAEILFQDQSRVLMCKLTAKSDESEE